MTYEKALSEIGVDITATLNRFSDNNDLMKKFICKFPHDPTLNALKEAADKKNYKEIENTAHTLKGVSGNLGFTDLYNQSSSLVIAVREKRNSDADKLCAIVINLCEKINNIILQIN